MNIRNRLKRLEEAEIINEIFLPAEDMKAHWENQQRMSREELDELDLECAKTPRQTAAIEEAFRFFTNEEKYAYLNGNYASIRPEAKRRLINAHKIKN